MNAAVIELEGNHAAAVTQSVIYIVPNQALVINTPGFFIGDTLHGGLPKEQPGVLAAQPDQRWHHLLPAKQPDPGIDADSDRL